MVKAYCYDPETTWPSSKPRPGATLRLDDGVEKVGDPDAADVFVVPWLIFDYERHGISPQAHLPHLKGREERHVWLEIADCHSRHVETIGNGTLFTCNLSQERLRRHPNAVSFPWPAEDLFAHSDPPAEGFAFDACFQGWGSCDVRSLSAHSCRAAGLKAHVEVYPDFYGHYCSTERGKARRASFLDTMRRSKVALCPRSELGVFPYRFFEAMSAARVPALVCDAYVLPFADRIPYSDFCILIRESDAGRAGQLIKDWLASRNIDEVVRLGRLARQHWERWLDARKWPSTMRQVLDERFGKA